MWGDSPSKPASLIDSWPLWRQQPFPTLLMSDQETTLRSTLKSYGSPSSGTVEIMVLCLDRPWTSTSHLLRTHAYPKRWLAMKVVGAAGASVEWFRKTFCQEMPRRAFYDDFMADVLSAHTRPEARFHPFLGHAQSSGVRRTLRRSWLMLLLRRVRERPPFRVMVG